MLPSLFATFCLAGVECSVGRFGSSSAMMGVVAISTCWTEVVPSLFSRLLESPTSSSLVFPELVLTAAAATGSLSALLTTEPFPTSSLPPASVFSLAMSLVFTTSCSLAVTSSRVSSASGGGGVRIRRLLLGGEAARGRRPALPIVKFPGAWSSKLL